MALVFGQEWASATVGVTQSKGMRRGAFRYLIAFVAAMFIANNAVASLSASLTSLGRLGALAAMHIHPATERLEHAAHIDAHCVAQCIQSYRDPTQELAANGLAIAPVPTSPGPGLSVKTGPTAARIAWAPEFSGPKLFILFGNLRN